MENKAKKLKALSIVAVCIILMLCICLVIFSGCYAKKGDNYKEYDNNRFIMIERHNAVDDNATNFYLLVDKETKVIYIYTSQGGITPLLDSKGEPQKYKGVL